MNEEEERGRREVKEMVRENRRNIGLVLGYSFLLWFLPSEPYLVELLEEKGFTASQVYQDIFPVWTYSYCLSVLPLALLGELLSYKLCVLIGVLGFFLASFILILPLSYSSSEYYYYLILFDEFAEGVGFASSALFSSFLFISFPPRLYSLIVGTSRSLKLLATVSSSIVGGVIVNFTSLPLISLFYISTFIIFIVFIVSLFLKDDRPLRLLSKPELSKLIEQVKQTASNWRIIKIGLWNAICLATHQLVMTYIQTLFGAVNADTSMNGFVYSFAYLFAAFFALLPSAFPRSLFERGANVMMGSVPIVCGAMLVLLGLTSNPALVYILFIAYHSLFEFVYTISTILLAIFMENRRFASAFSASLLTSLVYQSVVQFIVGKRVLNLSIEEQFFVFGASFALAGVFFCFINLIEFCFPSIVRRYNRSFENNAINNSYHNDNINNSDDDNNNIVKKTRSNNNIAEKSNHRSDGRQYVKINDGDDDGGGRVGNSSNSLVEN